MYQKKIVRNVSKAFVALRSEDGLQSVRIAPEKDLVLELESDYRRFLAAIKRWQKAGLLKLEDHKQMEKKEASQPKPPVEVKAEVPKPEAKPVEMKAAEPKAVKPKAKRIPKIKKRQ